MKLYPTLAILCTGISLAQNPVPGPPGGPPPPPGAPGTPPPPGHLNDDARPNRPFADMMRQRMDGKGGMPGIEMLTEDERKHLRSVMEQVWNKNEVKSARDTAADAAKKYRDVMHEAALKVDPALAPLLDKIKANMDKMPMGPGFKPPGGPDEPRPENNSPYTRGAGRGDGPRSFGLDPAELEKIPEDQRARLRGAFEKIMQQPEVQAAREATEKADGEGKREAFHKMREVIKAATEKEYPELAKLVESLRGQGPPRGPSGSGRPGPAPAPEQAPPPPPTGGLTPPANTPGAPENAPPR